MPDVNVRRRSSLRIKALVFLIVMLLLVGIMVMPTVAETARKYLGDGNYRAVLVALIAIAELFGIWLYLLCLPIKVARFIQDLLRP